MRKALIISDKFNFVQELLNSISNKNIDLHIHGISGDFTEAFKLLDENECHIVLFDEVPQIQQIENTETEINNFSEIRKKIVDELLYLGYNFKYNGTHYLLDAILEVHKRKLNTLDNLQGSIYPIIAKKYNKGIQNVKNSIDNTIMYMYRECNIEKLKKYFNLQADTKPSAKTVIFTIVKKL